MPFDPTKPVEGSEIDANELRNQFNGLKALIDAIPAGPPGPEGPEGPQGPGVSMTDVTNAIGTEIAGTARNPNTVAPLNLGSTDFQITAIVDKINELIAALAR